MTITMSDLEEAAERVMMGPERRSRVISDNEKRLTAIMKEVTPWWVCS